MANWFLDEIGTVDHGYTYVAANKLNTHRAHSKAELYN